MPMPRTADLGVGLKAFYGAPNRHPHRPAMLEHFKIYLGIPHADFTLRLRAASAETSATLESSQRNQR